MASVNIEFYNYSKSEFVKTRGYKNLRKLLFAFSQVIYGFYISVYSFLLSRTPFVKEEYFSNEKVVRNLYLENTNYFDTKRYENISNSYNLKVAYPSFYEAYFHINPTKSGVSDLVKYYGFLRLCVEMFYNEDFCLQKANSVRFVVGEIEENIADGTIISDISSPMEISLLVLNESGDSVVDRIIKSRTFVNYVTQELNKYIPFLHLKGIYIE